MTKRSRAGAGPGPTAENQRTDNNIEEDEVFEPEVDSSNQQENMT